jgi:putative addiction module antidote
MLSAKIRRIGNSLGATLPKEVLDRMKVSEGDVIYLTETPGGFQITPYDEEFSKSLEAFGRAHKRYRNAFRELAK